MKGTERARRSEPSRRTAAPRSRRAPPRAARAMARAPRNARAEREVKRYEAFLEVE
jgi:hypothetical protein